MGTPTPGAKIPAGQGVECALGKVGRAVEGTGLENRQGRKLLASSNLAPSAKFGGLCLPNSNKGYFAFTANYKMLGLGPRGRVLGESAMSRVTCHQNVRTGARAFIFMAALIPLLEGCAVVAVADAAVTVVATTVKVGAKVVGAAVDLVIPDNDQEKK